MENNSEFESMYNKISKLDWNEKNLDVHTLRHPIGDCYNQNDNRDNIAYRLLWGNLLNIHNIPEDKNGENYNEIKEAYRLVSLKSLTNLNNSIIYFHNGFDKKTNKRYRSVGIFEDKDYKVSDKVLTTFIRGNFNNKKEDYYITTCYFKNRGFKEKFYYAYKLLKEPELFKINMDVNTFFERNGISKDFTLDKLNTLLDESIVADDKIGEIFNYCLINKRIDSSRYMYLVNFYNNNYSIKEKNDINKQINILNSVVDYINAWLKQFDSDDTLKLINLTLNTLVKVKRDSDKYREEVLKKYGDEDDLEKISELYFDYIDIENYIVDFCKNINIVEKDEEIEKFIEKYLSSIFLDILIRSERRIELFSKYKITNIFRRAIDIGFKDKWKYQFLLLLRKIIDERKAVLEEKLDEICFDDENTFYMSLCRDLAKYFCDYSCEMFKGQYRYDDEIEMILENNINN